MDEQHHRRMRRGRRRVEVEVLLDGGVWPVGDVVIDVLRAQASGGPEREQREAEDANPSYWTARKALTNPAP